MSTPIYDAATKPVTTDANTGEPTPKPTAKVAAGAIAGIALTVVVAVLGAIDVDLLSFLGGWAPVALVGIGALASSLTAYLKRPTGDVS